MNTVHRSIVATLIFLLVWVLTSFTAVMIATRNLEFWASSLLWSLVACIVIVPILVIVYDANREPVQTPTDRSERPEAEPSDERPAPFVGQETGTTVLHSDAGEGESTQE